MEVRELLSGEVVTVDRAASVEDAAGEMLRSGVGSLAVVDDDQLQGILTERDIVRCAASGQLAVDATIEEWMTPYPDSFLPDMAVSEAADWMLAAGYRHLPVTERDRLIGMVSIKDILWALTTERAV